MLFGEDTELLSLLCYFAYTDAHNINFKPEQRSNTKTAQHRGWNINETKLKLSKIISLLFVHELLGCDPTSSVLDFGKELP